MTDSLVSRQGLRLLFIFSGVVSNKWYYRKKTVISGKKKKKGRRIKNRTGEKEKRRVRREKEEKCGKWKRKLRWRKTTTKEEKLLSKNYILDTLIIQTLPTVSIRNAFLSSFYRRGIRGWKSNNFHWVTKCVFSEWYTFHLSQ